MNRRAFLAGLARPIGVDEPRAIPDPVSPLAFALEPSLEPYAGPWTRETAAHLLRRALLAPTHAELREGESMTMAALIDTLLSASDSLPAPPRYVAEWLNAEIVPWDSGRFELVSSFFDEARRWWLGLMIDSGMSIRERMTLFWHNHFANNYRLITDARTSFLQNQLFRRHAVGDFKALVRAVTVDPAMLDFLNGRNNKAGYVNENYARELQELFTIGITDNAGQPNYTQADIVQAARASGRYFGDQLVADGLLEGGDVTRALSRQAALRFDRSVQMIGEVTVSPAAPVRTVCQFPIGAMVVTGFRSRLPLEAATSLVASLTPSRMRMDPDSCSPEELQLSGPELRCWRQLASGQDASAVLDRAPAYEAALRLIAALVALGAIGGGEARDPVAELLRSA